MNKIKATLLISIMAMSLQGCIVAGIGAGVGAWKYGDAEKTKAATTCKNSYNEYLTKVKTTPLTLEQYCPEDK